MKNDIWSGIRLYIFYYMLFMAVAFPVRVYAQEAENDIEIYTDSNAGTEKEFKLPHLIQTVTEKDIYEGMLALGLLENKVLETADCEKAYENVRSCVVSINMGNAHGSGVVWDMTTTQTIIVTNKHVLKYWNDYISYVYFPQGYYLDAEVLGTSKEHDIGFLAVDNTKLDYKELGSLRYIRKDMYAYEGMQSGDEIFCLGGQLNKKQNNKPITKAEDDENFYKGSIGDMQRYINEFGEYMIYGLGYAKPGMSGGGTFDAKGNFIGMISGGTSEGETASIPLSIIIEEYEKIR